MGTKSRSKIDRKRKRKENRNKLRAKGLNPDDFFKSGIYVGGK